MRCFLALQLAEELKEVSLEELGGLLVPGEETTAPKGNARHRVSLESVLGSVSESYFHGASEIFFEWEAKHSTWSVRSTKSGIDLLINETPLPSGDRRVLSLSSCRISACGVDLWFYRRPDSPSARSGPRRVFLIPPGGIVIGRGTDDRSAAADASERISLDSEILTISSSQARVFREGRDWYVENLHGSAKYRTKLNGNQNFIRELLVFGDCLQIPGYDFYTFQFDGRSLVHIGDGGIIQARGLERTVSGGKRILSNVDLDLRCGEFVGILGGSGQGKSTLMNAVCAINPATSGAVWLDGRKLEGAADIANEAIGYVPQDDIVHRELTVREALNYSARLRLKLAPRQIGQAIDGALRVLSLEEHQDKRIRILSGGQRKRVSIASELLTNPRFIFLDEPTSGLDPQTESDLMSELSLLARSKRMGIFCTTHVLQNSHLFNSIVFVQGGRRIFQGSPVDSVRYFLLERPFDPASRSASQSWAFDSTSPSHSRSDASRSGADMEISEDELLGKLPKVYGQIDREAKRISRDSGGRLQPGDDKTSETMEQAYLESSYCVPLSPVNLAAHGRKASRSARPKKERPGFLATLLILISRQWRILASDPLNVLFLLAQAVVIGALVGWVNENLVFQMFIAVIATLWFGCSNGAQQIVGELPIFRRERLAGVGINVYLLGKFLFLTGLTAAQAIILFLSVLVTHHAFHPEILPTTEFNSRAKNAEEFTKIFFSGHSGVQESDPSPASSESTFSVADFVVESTIPEDQEMVHPRTVFQNPTGLSENQWEFAALERLSWFFRVRENVLDELGVYQVKVAPGEEVPESRRRAWVPFFLLLLGLRVGALLAAAVVGVALGLTVSALVRSDTQAVMWVPLILIPQILFGGFVVTSPEMARPVMLFAEFLPSYNVHRLQDVANVYGRSTPLVTNKTKIPAFFAKVPYDEETVRWVNQRGNKWEERYDRISEVNKSWQNLLVIRPFIGERDKVERVDSVNFRRDVLFPEGVPYRFFASASTSALVLAGWVLACYLAIYLGLRSRQIQ